MKAIEWERDLQKQFFVLVGMVLTASASLAQLKVHRDFSGLLGWIAGEIASLHPETSSDETLIEKHREINRVCTGALNEILKSTPEVPPD